MKNETAMAIRDIKSLDYYLQNYTRDYSDKIHMYMLMAIEALEQELKSGYWIDRETYDADRWECSECGRTSQNRGNYCSSCGAKMIVPRKVRYN